MRILINAVALKVAGSKSVCMNFLRSLETVGKEHEYYVFLPGGVGYEILKGSNYLNLEFIPLNFTKPIFRYYIDHIFMKKQIKKINPDAIFSMGNIALPEKNVSQLLLFHFSHAVYPESVYWGRIGWRSRVHFKLVVREISKKLKYATRIVAQTECIKNRLSYLFGLEKKLKVVPNAVSLDSFWSFTFEDDTKKEKTGKIEQFKFLCLSRYYEHKNFEVFIPLAYLIKEQKLKYKITITISCDQHRKAKKFLKKIKDQGLEDVIENIGPVRTDDVAMIYHASDATLLPTLLESFSGTYIESAYFRKPVFTSDMDFAREICGDAAIYFDPLDPSDILMKMRYIEDSSYIDKIVRGALINLNNFPSWQDVAKMYLQELEEMTIRDRS